LVTNERIPVIYRFGEYCLDSALFELRRNGERVDIEPQVFSLLLHLIRNRDQVVSKDDLIDAVWQGRAISDTTLSSRIFALRKALGDTGDRQTVIKTVPRRGYRFVGDVTAHKINSFTAGQYENGSQARASPDSDTTVSDVAPVNTSGAMAMNATPPTVLPTLAVLPFRSSSEGLGEYFCEGLTEDIISNLTHFSELQVIASGSSFQFKDRTITLTQIARELHADYMVDGSVRRDGNRLRIAVQLIDGTTGVSLWADRYDREMEDVFAVQDTVTHMIVASLGVKMQNTALSRALRKSPTELDAYDCLLRARRYTATLNEEMHAEARDLLEKAIVLDHHYADAHALLANVYLAEYRFEANPRPDPVGRALEMAVKATQLDPQSAYAHCWLAIVHFFRKDNGAFEAEAKRALELNPNDPEILADIGHFLAFMGEFERGIELSQRAQQLNPLHPGWYHFSFARLHYHQCAYEDTLLDVQRVSMPDFYWTHLLKAAALGQLVRHEAGASLKRLQELKPGISVSTEIQKWNAAPDDCEHLMDGLRKAGLTE
jgi:TolB-like protein